MTTTLGTLEVEHAARQAAGNWRRFDCFVWDRATDLDEPDDWTIIYTHHRDSGLLDQSNAAATAAALGPFTKGDDPDAVPERHRHWACGWIDGFSVRVFRQGEITEAFRTYHELARRLADYPVLDETDYSNREYEATVQNISEAAWRLGRHFDLPEGWPGDVYEWLADHRPHAVEDRDDQGGWPGEGDLEAAFLALGYARVA
jgi:hypothetical protein